MAPRATPQEIQGVMKQIEALLLASQPHARGATQTTVALPTTTQQAAISTEGGGDELLVTVIVT